MNCSFCGKEIKSDMILVGNSGCICDDCLSLANKYKNNYIDNIANVKLNDVPKPHDIKKFLDDYIIGQDHVKERISVAVYNHYKRISLNYIDDVEIDKSNIILLGPTGSGKTLIARTIAKMLDVPFTIVDATTMTESGYVGDDVESTLVRLYQAADYDIEKTERGIVFIDEIDKIARKSDNPSITRDVSGEGVQQGLLKLLEGSVVSIPPKGGRKHPEQPLININTKNILFICAGAFVGIDKIIEQRTNKRTIGFESNNKKNKIDKESIMNKITANDLKKFGLIPEIIGRLPVITHTDELDKTALLKIMTEPKNALVKQYKKLFEIDGVELTFTDGALDYIATETLKNGLGARGLRSIMEDIMNKAMFDAPSNPDMKVLKIDKTYVKKKIN